MPSKKKPSAVDVTFHVQAVETHPITGKMITYTPEGPTGFFHPIRVKSYAKSFFAEVLEGITAGKNILIVQEVKK